MAPTTPPNAPKQIPRRASRIDVPHPFSRLPHVGVQDRPRTHQPPQESVSTDRHRGGAHCALPDTGYRQAWAWSAVTRDSVSWWLICWPSGAAHAPVPPFTSRPLRCAQRTLPNSSSAPHDSQPDHSSTLSPAAMRSWRAWPSSNPSRHPVLPHGGPPPPRRPACRPAIDQTRDRSVHQRPRRWWTATAKRR